MEWKWAERGREPSEGLRPCGYIVLRAQRKADPQLYFALYLNIIAGFSIYTLNSGSRRIMTICRSRVERRPNLHTFPSDFSPLSNADGFLVSRRRSG
jgi:hypothetical protein